MSSDTARPAGKGLSKAFVWFHATSANGGAMAIMPALTLDERERNDVLSKGAGVCALMYTIASTFTPPTGGIGGELSQSDAHLRCVFRSLLLGACTRL